MKSFDLVYDSAWDRERRERERERRKSLSSSFHGNHEAIIIRYTHTRAHTHVTLQRLRIMKVRYVRFKRQYQCVCAYNMVGLFEVVIYTSSK